MWSFFSSDPTKSFKYDIQDQEKILENKSIWNLFSGSKKGTGEPVSVFTFDVKGSSDTQVQLAKAAFKRIKTLRHPNILSYLDGLETEKVLYIVTERVQPLEAFLQKQGDGNIQQHSISWGLYHIINGLSFLNKDCGLIHNNVCLSSVFVDKAGEWKLSGVEYMYPSQGPDNTPPVKILPSLEKYNPPEKNTPNQGRGAPPWATDMWGVGCLIWEVFNGPLTRPSSLKAPGKIPKNLIPSYCELVGANPRSRPNESNFLDKCRDKGGFMDNPLILTMLFMEELQIKDETEKNKLFKGLPLLLDTFPPDLCRHKILPLLLNVFEFGNAGSAVLAPLFKVGALLGPEEYQRKIVPCVVKLFSSPDRALRVKLLQQISQFVEHLQPDTVNNDIFPHVIQGFMDTNPAVREVTVKAFLHLACKLNYKNLNEELMKHFARLQAKDDQGGIRTNTTVCLGKISCYLHPQIRQKILISAFLRATKDPFSPARQAGVLGMAATQNYYLLKDIACRLIPSLSLLTMDPEKTIRDQTFKALKGFVAKLEQASEKPESIPDLEREVMSGSGAMASNMSSWAGWAVSGMSSLTAKIYKQPSKPVAKQVQQSTVSTTDSTESSPSPDRQNESASMADAENRISPNHGREEDNWRDMDDHDDSDADENAVTTTESGDWDDAAGWDGDTTWQSLEGSFTPHQSRSAPSAPSAADAWGDWGNDDITAQDDNIHPASSYDWGGQVDGLGDDFFSAELKTKKTAGKPKAKPVVQQSTTTSIPQKSKVTVATTPTDPDNDSWGFDDWTEQEPHSSADDKKREREEKRLQRQKELQEKREQKKIGALKLGAKKS